MEDINYDQFLKIPRSEWVSGRSINMHSKFDVIGLIENILRREGEYELAEETVFRYLLKIPAKHMFAARLIQQLLQREINLEEASPHEIWFSIGGRKSRFSRVEFCLMTGLRFGPLPDIIQRPYVMVAGGIHNRYFDGKIPLLLSEIHNHLATKEFHQQGDCLKMALVLLANIVLFGQLSKGKTTLWLLMLVENVDEWNAFPWGHYVFKLTLYYLRTVVGKRNYYGFPYALQVGFYLFCFMC